MANFIDIIISAHYSNAAIAWTSKKPLVGSSTWILAPAFDTTIITGKQLLPRLSQQCCAAERL